MTSLQLKSSPTFQVKPSYFFPIYTTLFCKQPISPLLGNSPPLLWFLNSKILSSHVSPSCVE
jgi:hypothetical protein